MTKTIEEAANEYADNAYYPAPDYNWYESDDEQMKECLADTFKAGANHVYGLPLASRMTEEEKERVRKEYWQAARDWIGVGDARGYCKTCIALESIFGKDFFKEGE